MSLLVYWDETNKCWRDSLTGELADVWLSVAQAPEMMKPFELGEIVSIPESLRYDVLYGYGYPMQPRDQFFALLNMPGAE